MNVELFTIQFKWAIRRFFLKLDRNFLVLEVGSGGNPSPRSDILLEPNPDGEHIDSKPVTTDRPLFRFPAERMPFKSKIFDFSIAIHVLEHSLQPNSFLNELTRVSKGGYIETPSYLNEILFPYTFHASAVDIFENKLRIYSKTHEKYEVDFKASRNIRGITSLKGFSDFYFKNPYQFNVVYHWRGDILYETFGPFNYQTNYQVKNEFPHHINGVDIKSLLKPFAMSVMRFLLRQGLRREIIDLLKCPNCGNEKFSEKKENNFHIYSCSDCDFKIQKSGYVYTQLY